ncbi:MAG: hypothetical protein K8S56_02400 [Candidatus Cloacimonetes bacterium]|nr:hypothetical protein [Candidatus Cloacimonadota bacterium]
MSNYRYGNDYLVTAFKETTYGDYTGDYSVVATILPDAAEFKPQQEAIEIKSKTGSVVPQGSEVLAGKSSGTVTIKGELSHKHLWLLAAFCGDSSSPYEIQNSWTPWSHELHQYFLTDDKGFRATGCVLESLKLSGESGSTIQYEAVFRAREIISEVDFNAGDFVDYGNLLNWSNTPFLFGDIVSVNLLDNNDYATFNRFNLNLNRSFANDDLSYQNAMKRNSDLLTGVSGSFGFETNYFNNSSGLFEDQLLHSAIKRIQFSLKDGTNTWLVTLYGKLSEVSPADPDRQIFVLAAEMRLAGDSTNQPLSIIVS